MNAVVMSVSPSGNRLALQDSMLRCGSLHMALLGPLNNVGFCAAIETQPESSAPNPTGFGPHVM
jgi:hypothetical protein